MSRVTSKDGTAIAYERRGTGPALVLVDGAMGHRGFGAMPALASLLEDAFTVYAYDRRGRGHSGDTAPYAVAREVEDLGAVIGAAGGSAFVYGISSGAALTLEAAASGLPIGRIALYEPPYTAADREPGRKKEYTEHLDALLAQGRNGDAVAYFLTFVGQPAEAVAGMRHSPVWPMFEAVAPTLAYDNAVLGEAVVPVERAALVTAPALVLDGGASPAAMRGACGALARALPAGTYRTLEGETHQVSPAALAPALREFFG
jgi:pimeloyl-ACP methyl ester carboxylesterase